MLSVRSLHPTHLHIGLAIASANEGSSGTPGVEKASGQEKDIYLKAEVFDLSKVKWTAEVRG